MIYRVMMIVDQRKIMRKNKDLLPYFSTVATLIKHENKLKWSMRRWVDEYTTQPEDKKEKTIKKEDFEKIKKIADAHNLHIEYIRPTKRSLLIDNLYYFEGKSRLIECYEDLNENRRYFSLQGSGV